MKTQTTHHSYLRAVWCAACCAVFLLTGNFPASAFMSTDATTCYNAWWSTFSGGGIGMWTGAESIEMVEDVGVTADINTMCNKFTSANGTDWSSDTFNDDIMWATIAFTRAYFATGNTAYRTYAKNNFDVAYSRGWDPVNGGMYWNTSDSSKNSCVNFPAAIAAHLLSIALNDASYETKGNNIFTWGLTNLFVSSSGLVKDSLGSSTSYSYNQGTFAGAAYYYGYLVAATNSCNYVKNNYGTTMPVYPTGGNDQSGFNGICLRWMATMGYDPAYRQAVANNAWYQRNINNLVWNDWNTLTPNSSQNSWDCSDVVVAMNTVPADGTIVDSQAFTQPLLGGDFDRDGVPDGVKFDPSTGWWEVRFSSDASLHSFQFGRSGDIGMMKGDFDGDGQPDAVLFRPSTGYWYVRFSSDASVHSFQFGQSGDTPLLGTGFGGDTVPDAVLFRPSTGYWYVRFSSDGSLHQFSFGQSGDIAMMNGDFDGDGESDAVLFRPSNGEWLTRFSKDDSVHTHYFGQSGDIPFVTGDFDGDGQPDTAVFRPSNGTWYVRFSSDASVHSFQFGQNGDIPIMNTDDFDGDGHPDAVIFRPSNNTWYVRFSSDGSSHSFSF